MRVLFISPDFPQEMPLFCTALAEAGAEVIGLGEGPVERFPDEVRAALSGLIEARDDATMINAVRAAAARKPFDRIECLWEPGVTMAAELREALGVPGLNVEQTRAFRDKEVMKAALEKAGLRVPRHGRANTEHHVRELIEEIGYPIIIKPIAGAGSADTYRLDNEAELQGVLPNLRHVPEVSVEEYVDGEEYTFDTICANGSVLFQNVSWYRPKPLIGRSVQWISPQTVGLRDIESKDLASGRELGLGVLKALGFENGFTHMEWFRRPNGEAVFCEIACRPPGARSVDVMNQVVDGNLFKVWAESVVTGKVAEPPKRQYNAAVIFKRAQGEGRIVRIEGLDPLLSDFGPNVVGVDLLPIGAPRRNWKQTLLSDGFVTLRHPDLATLTGMADRVGTDLQLYAE